MFSYANADVPLNCYVIHSGYLSKGCPQKVPKLSEPLETRWMDTWTSCISLSCCCINSSYAVNAGLFIYLVSHTLSFCPTFVLFLHLSELKICDLIWCKDNRLCLVVIFASCFYYLENYVYIIILFIYIVIVKGMCSKEYNICIT